jgi:hypothetical protein
LATNGAIKHSFIGRVTPQDEVLLPATLAIVQPDVASATIRVRVMAFQDRRPRVLRDVRTTVPTGGRTALLRVPLNFVDDGMLVGPQLPTGIVPDPVPGTGGTAGTTGGTAGSSGGTMDAGSSGADPGSVFGTSAGDFDFMHAFQSPCPNVDTDTIIDGDCKDSYIDPSSLPDFDANELGSFEGVRCGNGHDRLRGAMLRWCPRRRKHGGPRELRGVGECSARRRRRPESRAA